MASTSGIAEASVGKEADSSAKSAACPICESATGARATPVTVAGRRVFRCRTCDGFFLLPRFSITYADSAWTKAREASWEQDLWIARDYAPRILAHVGALLGRPVTSVLEIGCGSGYMGAGFAAAGCVYTGIDIDAHAVAFARSRGIDAHHLPAEQLADSPLAGLRYDLVLSSNVFEHVARPREVFAAAARASQGAIVVIVPNALGLFQRLRANRWIRRLAQSVLGYPHDVAYSLDGKWHAMAFTARTLDTFCRELGLRSLEARTMDTNDPLFGFVMKNDSMLYRLAAGAANLLAMNSELLLIAGHDPDATDPSDMSVLPGLRP